MNLYDAQIKSLKDILEGQDVKKLPLDTGWEVTEKENLILKSEMAYELGGGNEYAVSALAFTTDPEILPEDSLYLTGSDLREIKSDISYARITIVRFKDEYAISRKDSEMYGVMRATDYVRYHTFPKGYMMRISSVREREPVRVSREALDRGISFAKVGTELIKAYKKRPEVESVGIYFITDAGTDYKKLKNMAHRCEQITDSLNHIFNGMIMDCNTCSSKALCDEIEGLRQIHMNNI